MFAPYNFSLGDRELRRAIELSPSLALARQYLGFSLLLQGRLDEGLEEFLKARELDPLSPIIARGLAFCYHLKRDYVRALELLRQANELGPAFTTQWEIGMYIQNKSFNEALAELEKAKRERKSDPPFDLRYGHSLRGAGQTGGSPPDHQRAGSDVRREPGRGALDCQNLCGLERKGDGVFVAGTWLSRGSDRSLL